MSTDTVMATVDYVSWRAVFNWTMGRRTWHCVAGPPDQSHEVRENLVMGLSSAGMSRSEEIPREKSPDRIYRA